MGRILHFDVVFFRIEASVRQQTFIHGTQLVDTQVGIADAAAIAILLTQ